MIVVSRVDVNKFLNHDQKFLKAVFLNHFSHATKVNVMCDIDQNQGQTTDPVMCGWPNRSKWYSIPVVT